MTCTAAAAIVGGGCAPTLMQQYQSRLPGGERAGRTLFGVGQADTVDVVFLNTTGIFESDVREASEERFNNYLNTGYVPLGVAVSRNPGQGEPQARLLATGHDASIAVVEVNDPKGSWRTIDAHVPTLITESVRIDGTTNFEGDITRIGWAPGKTSVWHDPYTVTCTLWARREWLPPLGVYFALEMRAFQGRPEKYFRPTMKASADRWRLRHPGEEVPVRGAEIRRVIPNTLADQLGLHASDILVSIGDIDIDDEAEARAAITRAFLPRNPSSFEIVLMRRSNRLDLIAAEGWDVSTPTNPLFSDEKVLPWQQISRDVRE
jgi:hypothetical protein